MVLAYLYENCSTVERSVAVSHAGGGHVWRQRDIVDGEGTCRSYIINDKSLSLPTSFLYVN